MLAHLNTYDFDLERMVTLTGELRVCLGKTISLYLGSGYYCKLWNKSP